MSVTRYKGQPLPFVVEFSSNPLTVYTVQYSDVENISMNLKVRTDTDSDSAYLEKFWKIDDVETGEVVFDQVNHKFIMHPGDYGNAVPGKYRIVVGVKVSQFAKMIELILEDDEVVITEDRQRA